MEINVQIAKKTNLKETPKSNSDLDMKRNCNYILLSSFVAAPINEIL